MLKFLAGLVSATAGWILIGSAVAANASVDDGRSHAIAVIPKPVSITPAEGEFRLAADVPIVVDPADPRVLDLARRFARRLDAVLTGAVRVRETAPAEGRYLHLTPAGPLAKFGPEGYRLVISPERVVLQAKAPAGFFYGLQTLRQLLPPTIEAPLPGLSKPGHAKPPAKNVALPVPAVTIVDEPRFAWRGFMLDCSRTFLPIPYLKRYVDLLACHKMNVLHLHLTDDQGWRLEIKKHPKLTEVGSKWDPRVKNDVDGHYTQDQMRDLIAYAKDRFVTIVPEIEMPGHCLGALTAYPELACNPAEFYLVPFLMMTNPKSDPPPPPMAVFCAGNDRVFEVLEDCLAEVIELFPSTYIHIGGDECPKVFWENCPKCQARIQAENLADEHGLQSYFIRRVEKMITKRGRRLVGWDEILEGGLAPEATVMSWQGSEGGIAAAKQGHDVVMADRFYLYFDYPHEQTPMSKTYSYNPVPAELTAEQARHVLGAQGQMWTHVVRDEVGLERWIFPRFVALAEVVWTPADQREWADFERRMRPHYRRLDALGVNYHNKQTPATRPGS